MILPSGVTAGASIPAIFFHYYLLQLLVMVLQYERNSILSHRLNQALPLHEQRNYEF